MFDRNGARIYHPLNTDLQRVACVEVILRKYGNSTVLALPPAVLKELGLKAGQTMTLTSTLDGRITLVPKRRYKLADLIAQCDPKAAPPADLELWNHAKPVGREVWRWRYLSAGIS